MGSKFVSVDQFDTKLIMTSLENTNSLVDRDLENFNQIEVKILIFIFPRTLQLTYYELIERNAS